MVTGAKNRKFLQIKLGQFSFNFAAMGLGSTLPDGAQHS